MKANATTSTSSLRATAAGEDEGGAVGLHVDALEAQAGNVHPQLRGAGGVAHVDGGGVGGVALIQDGDGVAGDELEMKPVLSVLQQADYRDIEHQIFSSSSIM